MQAELLSYIADKHISGALADRLAGLDESAAAAICGLLRALAPSANTLREYLRLLDEVAARDGTSIAVLLADEGIQRALVEPGSSRKERQKKVRLHCERLRYPELGRIEERLERCCRELLQKTGLRIELPPDYEGDSVQLTISSRSTEDFAKLAQKLCLLAEDEQCAELFSVLRGDL